MNLLTIGGHSYSLPFLYNFSWSQSPVFIAGMLLASNYSKINVGMDLIPLSKLTFVSVKFMENPGSHENLTSKVSAIEET